MLLVAVGLVAMCASSALAYTLSTQGAGSWYIVSNAYYYSADSMWYYTYELLGSTNPTPDTNLNHIYILGMPPGVWTEVLGSPQPDFGDIGVLGGTATAAPWSDSTGYTMGYFWDIGVQAPAGLHWPTLATWDQDFTAGGLYFGDADGVKEDNEPGTDNGWLYHYPDADTAWTVPPVSPPSGSTYSWTDGALTGSSAQDIVAGWFQIKSPNPPQGTTYHIVDHGDWFGPTLMPTPEPTSLALLALGLPMGLGALRRRNKKA